MSPRHWATKSLPEIWLRRGPGSWLLWPVSLLFRLLIAGRKSLYKWGVFRSRKLPVPVVVVGNVLAGGSGKTPVVIAVVQHLQAQGWRPGVISRGYGRLTPECREVEAHDSATHAGDEPLLIKHKTGAPVFVAPQRSEAARALLKMHPLTDVLICDDGLQHLALQRDIEICVFDERGVGNGFLLPAGPLREPWPRKVDLVLNSGVVRAIKEGYVSHRQLSQFAGRADGSTQSLASLGQAVHRPVVAVAGIAKPEQFFAMLIQAGLRPDMTVALPDHFDFAQPLKELQTANTVVCTEKDAVKLWPFAPHVWAVALQYEPDPAFFQAMDSLLQRTRDHQSAKLSSRHGSSTT